MSVTESNQQLLFFSSQDVDVLVLKTKKPDVDILPMGFSYYPKITKWKEVPAAQVSCGPAFTHTELKPTWLSTSSNHGGGHQASMGRGGHQPTMGGASAKYGGGHQSSMGVGHQPSMGGAISQVWGGHQPTIRGGHQPSMGGYLFSHQYVQEVKIHRITLATHTSCLL